MCFDCKMADGYGEESVGKDAAWFAEQRGPAASHNGPPPAANVSIIIGALLGVAFLAGIISCSCILYKNYKKKRSQSGPAGPTRTSPSHTIVGFLTHSPQKTPAPGHAHPSTPPDPALGPPISIIASPSAMLQPSPPAQPDLRASPSAQQLHRSLGRQVPTSRSRRDS